MRQGFPDLHSLPSVLLQSYSSYLSQNDAVADAMYAVIVFSATIHAVQKSAQVPNSRNNFINLLLTDFEKKSFPLLETEMNYPQTRCICLACSCGTTSIDITGV